MKLVQINTVCNGSTGKIMGDIQRKANEAGFETISYYGRRKGYKDLKCKKIGNIISFWHHVFINTIFDKQGYGSYFYTKKLISDLKKFKPDIIHLHNIHGYYLNIPLLFQYLNNEYDGRIFWTFHDCWPITGHCAHFILVNCSKWQDKCYNCPNKTTYPISLCLDSSESNYYEKKKIFTSMKNLTIITPSEWLHKIISKSFLHNKNIITINNGIDLNIFKSNCDNSIKVKYNIPNKKILLGVASNWNSKKGFDDFLKLSSIIDDNYIIVLVGLTKGQIKLLPKNIIGIEKTENQIELSKLYSISDFFVNLTYEDNFPTVNLEAIACGTPVITYDTGGCKEQITDTTGIVISEKNVSQVYDAIKNFNINFDNSKYLDRIDKNKRFEEIINLYKEINNEKK